MSERSSPKRPRAKKEGGTSFEWASWSRSLFALQGLAQRAAPTSEADVPHHDALHVYLLERQPDRAVVRILSFRYAGTM